MLYNQLICGNEQKKKGQYFPRWLSGTVPNMQKKGKSYYKPQNRSVV